jgi:hypothetical protein
MQGGAEVIHPARRPLPQSGRRCKADDVEEMHVSGMLWIRLLPIPAPSPLIAFEASTFIAPSTSPFIPAPLHVGGHDPKAPRAKSFLCAGPCLMAVSSGIIFSHCGIRIMLFA